MGEKDLRVTQAEDFRDYWDGVRRIVADTDPEVSLEKWEQEDVNFEDEYILDGPVGEREKQPEPMNPFDFRWDSHVILTGLTVKKVLFRSYDGQEVGGLLQFPRFSGRDRFPVLVHYAGYGGEVLIDSDKKNYKKYEGTISWISSKAEFTPKIVQTKEERVTLVYAVKVLVKNDGFLKIGMPGEVNFVK